MAARRWRFFRAPVPLWRIVVAVTIPFWLINILKAWIYVYQQEAIWKDAKDIVIVAANVRIYQNLTLALISGLIYFGLLKLGSLKVDRILLGLFGFVLSLCFAMTGRYLLVFFYALNGGHVSYGNGVGGLFLESFFTTPFVAIRSALDWFMTFWAGFAVVWGVYTYLRLRDERLHSARLRSQWLSARLEALIGQLNPHFLFNSLHTISAFIHKDQERADDLIVRLGDLLRRNLLGKQHVFTTFDDEMEAVGLYLSIEQTRFEDRMSVNLEIDPECSKSAIPPFILQPLVENAIKHGIASNPGSGYVNIEARRVQQHLEIRVVNSLVDGKPAMLSEGAGVGIRLTRERLQTAYGDGFEFFSGLTETGDWESRLKLPAVDSDRLSGAGLEQG